MLMAAMLEGRRLLLDKDIGRTEEWCSSSSVALDRHRVVFQGGSDEPTLEEVLSSPLKTAMNQVLQQ